MTGKIGIFAILYVAFHGRRNSFGWHIAEYERIKGKYRSRTASHALVASAEIPLFHGMTNLGNLLIKREDVVLPKFTM